MDNNSNPPTLILIIPSITSFHTFLKEIVHKLQQQEWRIFLCTNTTNLKHVNCYSDNISVEIIHVPFPRGLSLHRHLFSAWKLRSILLQIKPDICHVHFAATTFTAALAVQRTKIKIISTLHGLTGAAWGGVLKNLISLAESFAFSRMNQCWVLTDDDKLTLSTLIGAKKVKVYKSMGLGCDIDKFDRRLYPESVCRETRSELGIEEGIIIFAFIGRRVHFKGFALVVRAFQNILAAGVKAKLLLLGVTDCLHPTGLTSAEEEDLKSNPNVIDLGWVKSIEKYLAITDINVFPSVREGMPVNLMESLAMGVPVITSNSRGCNTVVQDGITGILLKDNTVDCLASAMLKMTNDRQYREVLGKNALNLRNRFDRNDWVNEQIQIYEEIIESRKSNVVGFE